MTIAICFTNFGPYHLARLRALAAHLSGRGDRLIAYEVAGSERRYPWSRSHGEEPFHWITLFPDRVLETIEPAACRRAMVEALEHDRPDALAVAGYSRPESMAAARWGRRRGCPVMLMSESQSIDRPRVWWKELIKKQRERQFDAGLVGGRRHLDYLVSLGMPRDRIALGYNAVDNDTYAANARSWRQNAASRLGLPPAPYFLSVCRFVADKNLVRLIEAFSRYRQLCDPSQAWDLVLCGDGPGAAEVQRGIEASGCAGAIHRPGFLQADALSRWYAHAATFVLASLVEPWGLVVNEAAACALPLLVSGRAGCAPTLVPGPPGTTGFRFDPLDVEELATQMSWMATCPAEDRLAMGKSAAETVSRWGPDRFACGFMEALQFDPDGRERTRGSLSGFATQER